MRTTRLPSSSVRQELVFRDNAAPVRAPPRGNIRASRLLPRGRRHCQRRSITLAEIYPIGQLAQGNCVALCRASAACRDVAMLAEGHYAAAAEPIAVCPRGTM